MVKPEKFETREELLEESDIHGVVPLKYIEEYLMGLASSKDAKYDAALVDLVHNLHKDDLSELALMIEANTIPNLVSLVESPETNEENILLQIGIMVYIKDNIEKELRRKSSED